MKILKLITATDDKSHLLRVLVEKSKIQPERFGTVAMVDDNPYIKNGDMITFGQYGGTDLAIPNDQVYLIMRMTDIYAIVDSLS